MRTKLIFLLVCSVFLGVLMSVSLLKNFYYYINSIHTNGVIVNVDSQSAPDALHGGFYVYPVVEFSNNRGEQVKFKSNESFLKGFLFAFYEPYIGKKVGILYNPYNPQDARIYDFINFWGINALFLFASIITILFLRKR